jgi:hypothetical protein
MAQRDVFWVMWVPALLVGLLSLVLTSTSLQNVREAPDHSYRRSRCLHRGDSRPTYVRDIVGFLDLPGVGVVVGPNWVVMSDWRVTLQAVHQATGGRLIILAPTSSSRKIRSAMRPERPVRRIPQTCRGCELREPAFEEAPFGTIVGELPRTSVRVTRLIHPPEAS